MNRKVISLSVFLATAALTVLGQPASAGVVSTRSPVATAAVTSTIVSPSTGTCVDVPGGSTDVNTNVVAASCDGAAEQEFSFRQLAGQPAGTYHIVNVVSGLCLTPFRFGVRQRACLQDQGSLLLASAWQIVSASGGTDILHPANGDYGDPATGRCVAAYPGGTNSLLLDFRNTSALNQQFTFPSLS